MHLFRLCCREAGSPAAQPFFVPFFNPRWQVREKIQIDPVSGGPRAARGRAHSVPRGANFDFPAPFFADLYYYTTMDYEDDPDEADEGGECGAARRGHWAIVESPRSSPCTM